MIIGTCVFSHNARVPEKLCEGQDLGPRETVRSSFENRFLSLGEVMGSLLCQTPPIYKCLHITLTIYLKSWGNIYFILETIAGRFSARGLLFFPLILL